MKLIKPIIFFLTLVTSIISFADVFVNGYYRGDGTYVQPHYRSSPNSTVTDNFSYFGHTNPYTGAIGTNKYYDNPTSDFYNPSNSIYNPSNSIFTPSSYSIFR